MVAWLCLGSLLISFGITWDVVGRLWCVSVFVGLVLVGIVMVIRLVMGSSLESVE